MAETPIRIPGLQGRAEIDVSLLLAENRVSGQTTEYVNLMIAKYS